MDFSTLQVREILVPVDGSQAAMDALALACVLAKRNKGKVYAVYVIEVARTMPLDADLSPEAREGEEILARAEQVADALDFEVTGELLQARDAGHAIVDEAIERGVDAIMAGTSHTRPLGEVQLGDTAQYVLRNAPCQVIVCRSAARSVTL
ncbi:MAG TPA: universal stress protein [Dehalococcoidia bacterium]|nr:universal stress protein [Dehalococcoidia bacterium]